MLGCSLRNGALGDKGSSTAPGGVNSASPELLARLNQESGSLGKLMGMRQG